MTSSPAATGGRRASASACRLMHPHAGQGGGLGQVGVERQQRRRRGRGRSAPAWRRPRARRARRRRAPRRRRPARAAAPRAPRGRAGPCRGAGRRRRRPAPAARRAPAAGTSSLPCRKPARTTSTMRPSMATEVSTTRGSADAGHRPRPGRPVRRTCRAPPSRLLGAEPVAEQPEADDHEAEQREGQVGLFSRKTGQAMPAADQHADDRADGARPRSARRRWRAGGPRRPRTAATVPRPSDAAEDVAERRSPRTTPSRAVEAPEHRVVAVGRRRRPTW